MKEFSQSGANKPLPAAGPLDCARVESWLTEAAEEHLPPGIADQLREHANGCADCQEKLEQARRGRDWLLVLKQEKLEPPADLVAKILARTSAADTSAATSVLRSIPMPDSSDRSFSPGGRTRPDDVAAGAHVHVKDRLGSHGEEYEPAEYASDSAVSSTIPAWQRSSLVALRHKFMEPRLALVAAMAFFSISLTLNLVGVHITKVRAADLQPQNLRRAVTRHYAEANAHVVRYYENLRIVYEVEARVQQLRRAAETAPTPQQPGGKPRKGSSDSSRDPGRRQGSQREATAGDEQRPEEKNATPVDPIPVTAGPRMDVALPVSQGIEIIRSVGIVILGPSLCSRINSAKDLTLILTEAEGSQPGNLLAANGNIRFYKEERRLA